MTGPTATGKTQLALCLASRYGAAILSVDSRQAYKDLNATTGKNLSPSATYQPKIEWEDQELGPVVEQGVEIWGYDFFDKDHEGSSGGYVARARAIEAWCEAHQQPLIYVGGSFHYLLSVLWPPASLNLKPNLVLRARLQYAPVEFLQHALLSLDITAKTRMNHSDWHNPTRLMRQIEIQMATTIPEPNAPKYDFVVLGIKPQWPAHGEIIRAHATSRFEGVMAELEEVEALPYLAATSLGYAQVRSYIKGECTRAQALERWVAKEVAYAKRQEAELSRLPGIHWVPIQADLEWEIVKLYETC